jgi:hypothetical protein
MKLNETPVLYTEFRERVPPRRRPALGFGNIGFGDASAVAADAEDQLAPLQLLVDRTQGDSSVDQQLVGNAQAAMLMLSGDLQMLKAATAGTPLPSSFNWNSFLAGLGVALVAGSILYVALDKPTRGRRTR